MYALTWPRHSVLQPVAVLALISSLLWPLLAGYAPSPSLGRLIDGARLASAPAGGTRATQASRVLGSLAAMPTGTENPVALLPDRWVAVQETIRQDLYTVSALGDEYRASNQTQKIDFTFDNNGVSLAPLVQPEGKNAVDSAAPGNRAWDLELSLKGYGYTDDVQPVPGAVVSADGNRVTYRRLDGSGAPLITEWYANGERGLEQGFVLSRPPAGSGANSSQQEVVLELGLTGNLVPVVRGEATAKQSVELVPAVAGSSLSVLRYADLHAFDAMGKELPARLAVLPGDQPSSQTGNETLGENYVLQLVVDDDGASYPLTIDPLLTNQVAEITPSDAADNDDFGAAVSVSGDTLVIGADGKAGYQGAAYIFYRNQDGADSWGLVKEITATDGVSGDYFGYSVSAGGDIAVVGAYYKSSGKGAAYVYSRNQGGLDNWGLVKEITATNGAINDWFGRSVAVSGDTIVVGAMNKATYQGSAYIFTRNQGGLDNWGLVKEVTALDAAGGDYFGQAVAVSGDTLLVGAYGKNSLQGAAYVFTRNKGGADNWGQVQELLEPSPSSFNSFGRAVAVSGDMAVVGAYGSSTMQGATYIFSRNQGGLDNWGLLKTLSTSDAAKSDNFGWSVSANGDTVVVGARRKFNYQGVAYIFTRNQGGADNWGQVQEITASDPVEGDQFGYALSISGNTIVGSAPNKSNARGAVYSYLREGTNWYQEAQPAATDGAAGDTFGWSVSSSGDTLVVGAYSKSSQLGAAYVFARNKGGTDNWGQVKKLLPSDGLAGDCFGQSVSLDGDTVVIGAFGKNSFRGAAYVFSRNKGGADNWGQVQELTDPGGVTLDVFGVSVSLSGDTALIGAHGDSSSKGAAYIYSRNQGGADNWGLVQKLIGSDTIATDYFGNPVSLSGDTAVVAAYYKSSNRGAVYVFARNQGGADNWGEVQKLTASDGASNDHFGASISVSGDTVAIGATGKSGNRGAGYIFAYNQGGASNWSPAKEILVSDGTYNDYFGASVSLSGDTLLVGAARKSSDQGAAYIFDRNQGGVDNWGETKKLTASDGASGDFFGISVSLCGNTAIVGAGFKSSHLGGAYIYPWDWQIGLDSAPNPSVIGQSVTFTATLGPSSSTLTGTVTFLDGGATMLGSAPVSAGQATFATSGLAVGSHPITAVYTGTLPSSSSPVTQVVKNSTVYLPLVLKNYSSGW